MWKYITIEWYLTVFDCFYTPHNPEESGWHREKRNCMALIRVHYNIADRMILSRSQKLNPEDRKTLLVGNKQVDAEFLGTYVPLMDESKWAVWRTYKDDRDPWCTKLRLVPNRR